MQWRYTAARVGFFGLDAWCCLPLALWCVHMRWWTLYLAVAGVIFFGVVQFYGMSVVAFGRWLRALIAGADRGGTAWAKRSQYA